MEHLTERQEEYLLFFAARDGRGNGISEAAERFGVSKATVSAVCTALTKYGMVQKAEQGELMLTAEGWSYIDRKLQTAREVATCLTSRLGLQPYVAEMEARKIVVSLQPSTVEAMLDSWKYGETAAAGDGAEKCSPLTELKPGTYEVPFEVRKAGRTELSMGDRGFLKPAFLVRDQSGCRVYLRPARFSYKPIHRKLMDGCLERLWYHAEGVWEESTMTPEGCYELPGGMLAVQQGERGTEAVVRIRARSTVGLRKMPESEADLVFLLEELRVKT